MLEWTTNGNPVNPNSPVVSGELIPYIEFFSPSTIPATGTTEVLITGGNFIPTNNLSIPASTINISGASSVVYSVISPAKISAMITTNNASGNLPVVISNGDRLSNIWGDKSIQILSDPYFQNVVLFLKGEGMNNSTNIIDSSPTPKIISVAGEARISTAQKKLGTGSIYFNRNINTFCSLSPSDSWLFLGDFTVEMWIFWDGLETNGGTVALSTGGPGSLDQLGIFSGRLLGYSDLSDSISGITANNWHHVAISRRQGIIRGFLNGIIKYSQSNMQSIGRNNATLFIGKRGDNNHPLGGYIDCLRITKNVGRYTSNFDPNTQTFLD